MPLIKKCDVNEYFAARRRARLHPLKAASQADATSLSGAKPGRICAKTAEFAKDFLGDHSSAAKPADDEGRGAL